MAVTAEIATRAVPAASKLSTLIQWTLLTFENFCLTQNNKFAVYFVTRCPPFDFCRDFSREWVEVDCIILNFKKSLIHST